MVHAGNGDLSGRRLRQAREARWYTQLRLAAEIGVSRQSISGLEE
jgi:DNA-binding XRE family transcriptional regulator